MEQYPYWFTHYYKPYKDLMSSSQTRKEEQLKAIYGTTSLIPETYAWFCDRFYETERQTVRKLFIDLVDKYEKSKWPKSAIEERIYSLHKCRTDIMNYEGSRKRGDYFNVSALPLKISDKLIDAFVFECDAVEYVRNGKHAQKVAKFVFQGLYHSDYSIKNTLDTICDWIQKDWINPQEFESQIKKYIAQPYFVGGYYSNHDENRRQLLNALKSHKNFYRKMASLFDEEIRKYNIESFKEHMKNEEYAPSFIAMPFADGSRMKPVRRWFSWRLE